MNFKLSTDVEKNPGSTQTNTDSHETIIEPVMQSDSSITQLVSPMILMDSRLYELGLQAIDVGGAGDCFFRLCIASIIRGGSRGGVEGVATPHLRIFFVVSLLDSS